MKITLQNIIKLGFAHWKLVVVFGFIFGLLGILYSYYSPSKYSSRLTFTVENNSMMSAGGLAGLASSIGLGMGLSKENIFEGDNLIELFKSKRLIESSLLDSVPGQKLNFISLYIKDYQLRKDWAKDTVMQKVNFSLNRKRSCFSIAEDSILNEIHNKVKENILKVGLINNKVTIFKIEIESSSPYFTRYFAEALLTNTENFYRQTKTEKLRASFNSLKRQVDSVRNRLNNDIENIANVNDALFNINPGVLRYRTPSTKKQIDIQANTVILSELVKNLEITRMSLLNTNPIIAVIDRPGFPLENKKFRKLYGGIFGGIFGGIIALLFLYVKTQYFKKLK